MPNKKDQKISNKKYKKSKKDKELKKLEALADRKKFEIADKDKMANTVGTRMKDDIRNLIRKFNRGEAKYGFVKGKVDDPKKEVLMNMKKGGGPGIEALRKVRPDVVKKMGYKKGGKVKRMSCPVDGMAKRGKTKIRKKGR
jgi:hypothetical protein